MRLDDENDQREGTDQTQSGGEPQPTPGEAGDDGEGDGSGDDGDDDGDDGDGDDGDDGNAAA